MYEGRLKLIVEKKIIYYSLQISICSFFIQEGKFVCYMRDFRGEFVFV